MSHFDTRHIALAEAAQLVEQAADDIEPAKKNPQAITLVYWKRKEAKLLRELAERIRNLDSLDTSILRKKEQCS